MISLKTYLEDLFATPMNTIGMGNVSAPSQDNIQVGSGDIITPICANISARKISKQRKKYKRYKL